MENNWCIKLTDDNKDIIVGYFEKQYVADYAGIIGRYYGYYDIDCFCNSEPFGTEITTEQFIEMIKDEGYKVMYNPIMNKFEYVCKPAYSGIKFNNSTNILSTSTNNPPINKFLAELDNDTKEVPGTPKYYDNSKGSLYQFAEHHKLNAWEFDIIKRVVRCREKGNFTEDLEKTKKVIDLYLKEYAK